MTKTETRNWKLHQINKETGEVINEADYFNVTLAQATIKFCETYKCDLGDIYFIEITKEQQIKNYITDRFNNMTYDEYEDMCCGTGTLDVLDEALSKYDADCELNDDEVAKLTEYCIKESTAFSERYAMYQLSQELED
jgi:hypothetical protein